LALRLFTVGKTALLATVHSPGNRGEDAILEPLRTHIQIRHAEGAEDEDILREVWKWWTGNGGPVHGAAGPRKEIVAFDPFRGLGGTWAAKALEMR
jgi:hypothetical protein